MVFCNSLVLFVIYRNYVRQIFIKTVVLGICFAKDLREVSEMRFISTTNLKLPLRIYHYGSSWNVTTEGPSQLQVFIRWVVATISYIYIAIVINTGSNLRQLGRVIICSLFFVLCSYLGMSHDQVDACQSSFRIPWLLFHKERTFLSLPPASPLPSPSRNQCRAERRDKTAI